MKLLEERIQKDGKVKQGNVLKVDAFLNHQMDVRLFKEMGKEFQKRFEGEEINKILTIEASGIGIACMVADVFDVPVVSQRKHKQRILLVMFIQHVLNLLLMGVFMTLLCLRNI